MNDGTEDDCTGVDSAEFDKGFAIGDFHRISIVIDEGDMEIWISVVCWKFTVDGLGEDLKVGFSLHINLTRIGVEEYNL